MSGLDAHDVPIIVEPGQRFPGHVPEGLLGLLLAEKARTAFEAIDAIHVKPGPPQGIQFHRLGIGISVYTVLVCHFLWKAVASKYLA